MKYDDLVYTGNIGLGTIVHQKEKKNMNFNWNVVSEDEFKERLTIVFQKVSEALSKTLGPYGSTTVIEKFGDMHITKDGWNVLKKIHFEDHTNQNLLQLLFNISSKVVIRVGDGSTSSIIAADTVLNELNKCSNLKNIRSKELMLALSKICEVISKNILAGAKHIDKEVDKDFNDIKKLAMISTNGDEEISNMIQDIYKETGNPFIEYKKSNTYKTNKKILEGFSLDTLTYIDEVYVTNEDGLSEAKNPYIIMFENKMEADTNTDLILRIAMRKASLEGRKLIVIAPYYDRLRLDKIRDGLNMAVRQRQPINTVYCRVSLLNRMSHDLYSDFSILSGARVFKEFDMDEVYKMAKDNEEALEKITEHVEGYLGSVEKISISDKSGTITGFSNVNKELEQVNFTNAVARYNKVREEALLNGKLNFDEYALKKRVSKLKGKMGSIEAGGGSDLEKTSNYDLLEDAVKACESAYNYGYNLGGNLIIPKTIEEMDKSDFTETEKVLCDIISKAFKNVFKMVMYNRYENTIDEGEYDSCISKSIEEGKCFNIVTEEYDSDVINSCYTDVEILNATVSIIGLLISSNQFISMKINREEN